MVGQERTSLEGARRELDHYRTKVEGLTHDVIIFFFLIIYSLQKCLVT
jgi:hypothetical protein